MSTRFVLVAYVLSLTACVGAATGQSPRARRVDDHIACVAAARTDGPTPPGAASGCHSIESTSPAWNDAWGLSLCGPCNFSYDDAVTRRERAHGHPHDCCYRARSPGPPPPLPSGGAHS